MNGIPTQCKAIKTELEELEAEKAGLQSQLPGLAGREKWEALQEIANITRRIVATGDRLNDCIRAFAPAYRVGVVVLDFVPQGSVVLPVTGHLWYLSPPTGQNLMESVPTQNDICDFVRSPISPTGSVGLSVDEQGSPVFDGQLFRSGTLSQLPAASTGLPVPTVEVIAAPPVMVPWSMVTAPASVPGLPPGVTLTGPPSVTPTPPPITVTATGTFATTSTIFGISFPVAIPFTYTLTFGLAPSGDINTPARICAIRPTGPGMLTTGAGGLIGLIFILAAPLLEPSITGTVVPILETSINTTILAAVAGAVPPGSVVSMRRIAISMLGLRFFPAVARFLP